MKRKHYLLVLASIAAFIGCAVPSSRAIIGLLVLPFIVVPAALRVWAPEKAEELENWMGKEVKITRNPDDRGANPRARAK